MNTPETLLYLAYACAVFSALIVLVLWWEMDWS